MSFPRSAAAVILLLVASTGCGDGGESDSDDVVAPDVTTFVGGDLDDVPVPPLAEPVGPLRELDGELLVRSYEVRNRTPREVMTFYQAAFADRPVLTPVRDVPGRATVLRGEWRLEDGVIRITTQRAPTLEEKGSDSLVTQLSLQFSP